MKLFLGLSILILFSLVTSVSGAGVTSNGASETTAMAILAKMPALVNGKVPVEGSFSASFAGGAQEATLAALNSKIPAQVSNAIPMTMATQLSSNIDEVATTSLPKGAVKWFQVAKSSTNAAVILTKAAVAGKTHVLLGYTVGHTGAKSVLGYSIVTSFGANTGHLDYMKSDSVAGSTNIRNFLFGLEGPKGTALTITNMAGGSGVVTTISAYGYTY